MGLKAALMVSLAIVRIWILVALTLTLGGLAFACSSGDGDTSATETPTGNGDIAGGTPTEGTPPDGSPATLDPGSTGVPGGPPTGNGDGPGGPRPTDPPPVPTSDPAGPAMGLTVISGGTCNAGDCFVDTGATFTLAVEVLRAPAPGYVLMQTFIDFGVYNPGASEDGAGPGSCSDGVGNGGGTDGVDRLDSECATAALTYLPETAAGDEIVWSDAAESVTIREARGVGLVQHGSITGLIPPLPVSDATGVVVRMQMSCPASPVTVPITLLPSGHLVAGTSGSLFVRSDDVQIIPFLSSITLHCQ